jgi:hypothetical protein
MENEIKIGMNVMLKKGVFKGQIGQVEKIEKFGKFTYLTIYLNEKYGSRCRIYECQSAVRLAK